jgi:hypothetical protein
MRIERFEIPGLAQHSYIIVSAGEAAVIDPSAASTGIRPLPLSTSC